MQISQRAQQIAPFYAMEFAKRAAALEADGHRVIRLNIGEPDFGPPPAFLDAVADLAGRGAPSGYTGALGTPALREAIAGFTREHFGADVSPDRIAVTAGASAALLLSCAALINPGDEVLIGDPAYPCNRQFAHGFGADVRLLPTTPEARFQLTAAQVDQAWGPDTRGVIVASPSNPTGTSLPRDELAALCTGVAARGGWTIVDEIYLGLADPQPERPAQSVLAAPAGASVDPSSIIVINSFSKYFGMTGWRLGWCVLPEALVPVAERLAQNFYVCPPATAQHAALACFTGDSLAVSESRRREFVERRTLVVDGLAAIGLDVPVTPDGAFYVYVDISSTGLNSWEFAERALREAQVAVTPGIDFGVATADTHIRISYAASTAQLTEAIDRLGTFVASIG